MTDARKLSTAKLRHYKDFFSHVSAIIALLGLNLVRIRRNIASSLILAALRGLLPLEVTYACCRDIGKKIRSNTIFRLIPAGVV
jgi:hypothetical protein